MSIVQAPDIAKGFPSIIVPGIQKHGGWSTASIFLHRQNEGKMESTQATVSQASKQVHLPPSPHPIWSVSVALAEQHAPDFLATPTVDLSPSLASVPSFTPWGI